MMSISPEHVWLQLLRPETVNLILGYKGGGKSALAYRVMELAVDEYGLQPIVVDFPRSARHLLPPDYQILTLSEALTSTSSVILVDEGTTKLPAGDAMDEFVKACSSLSRQRNQLMIFIFHTSRDIGSKALRGMDAICIKEPSDRQIEFGSKNSWFRRLLERAKKRFIEIPESERCRYTFVDSEKPPLQAIIVNELPSFWSEELSTAWGQYGDTSDAAGEEIVVDQDVIETMIAASEIKEGEGLVCCVCGDPCSKLISDVCRRCFENWVTAVEKGKLQKQKQPAALSTHRKPSAPT